MNYKPSKNVELDQGYNYGCLQNAFRQAGIEIGNAAYVHNDDIIELCNQLGVTLFHERNGKTKYRIHKNDPIIVIENTDNPLWQHATYYKKASDWKNLGGDVGGIIVLPRTK